MHFFPMFFSYNFPVADIAKEILSANRPDFTNTKEVHTLWILSIQPEKYLSIY